MSSVNEELVPGQSYTILPESWSEVHGYRCHLAIMQDKDGSYSVIVLNLPGTGSCGECEDSAIENAREAIAGVVESYREDGEPIPWITDYPLPSDAKAKWIVVNA